MKRFRGDARSSEEKATAEVLQRFRDGVVERWGLEAWGALDQHTAKSTVIQTLQEEQQESQDWHVAVEDCLSAVFSTGSWIFGFLDAWKQTGPVESAYRIRHSDRGSIYRIASYARLLPLILEARREILGQQAPLSPSEADRWFSEAIEDGEPAKWVDVHLRLLIPDSDVQAHGDLRSTLKNDPISAVSELWGASEQAGAIEASALIDTGSSFFASGRRVFFYRARTGRMVGLLRWADRIARRRATATQRVTEDYKQAFSNAVHLIMCGSFTDSPVYGHYYESRFESRPHLSAGSVYADQMISIEVLDLESTPAEVAAEYAEVRARHGANEKGNRFDWCSEHIAITALNMLEAEGFAMGDAGFYSELLRRWRRFAETRPNEEELLDRFQTTEQVRGTLRRIDAAHRRAIERDPERSTIGEIPHLFRRRDDHS